ncbi:glycosyl hydrolase [Coriobacteriales bacterium OH1046]|nr:glycosyl hydrolase [Coriobacteriales bacterium OH1046]
MAYEDIIARLTLEEKCALLSGETAFGTRGYPRKGVPVLHFSDGPHGMRVQGAGANHLGIGGSIPATCFPTAVTVSNTWDPALAEDIGEALAEESASMDNNVVLGPGLCIKRDPLCGRNFEYISEDPYLAGKMAAGYVRGIQGKGLAACPKHFAANQQETRRQASDSVLDERTLREIYLAGFEIAVEESHPKSIMTSYNLVNGVYANENKHLLKDILFDEWGFDGAVVTDWGGSNDHVAGVAAGSAFEMPAPGLNSARELIDAVAAGTLSIDDVDARVEEALKLILATDEAKRAYPKSFDADAHHELAREIAAQGIVLLKNEPVDGTPLLPLSPTKTVALIGDYAETPRYQGAGSSLVNCTKLDTLLDVAQADKGIKLIGYERGFERNGTANATMADAAIDLARQADIVVMCLGLSEVNESEGAERMRMALEANQTELLSKVRNVNPNVVVLLFCGSSIETDWANNARSIAYCALGGQAGALAVADVLTGRVNPSGKLAETWPVRYADVPTSGKFPSEKLTSEYREGLYVGYRYFLTNRIPTAYSFGYGLSYTSFTYSDLEIVDEGVEFTLANTGSVAGTEISQLYVALPEHKVFRPEQELKGFSKTALEPGASKRVLIRIDDKAFRYFNVKTGRWEIEGGTYELRVGAASDDIRLGVRLEVAGTNAPNPYEGLDIPAYETGAVKNVPDAQFAALLGHAIPSSETKIDRNVCFRDLGKSRSPILMLVSAIVTTLVRSSYKKGTPDLNALFIYNMPLRAIAKMAGGMASMGLVDALVREAKGWGLIGAIPFLLIGILSHRWGLAVLVWILWTLAPIIFEFVKNLVENSQLAAKLSK